MKIDQVSLGRIAPSLNQKAQVGQKSLLTLAQKQAAKDIKEGKQLSIGRALRVKKSLSNGSYC